MKTLFGSMEQRIDAVEERLLKNSFKPLQQKELIDRNSQPSQHQDPGLTQESTRDALGEWHLPANIPSGHTQSEDPGAKQDFERDKLEEGHLPASFPPGQTSFEAHTCNHPNNYQMPATGHEANEKIGLEQTLLACDQLSKILLSKTQEQQRRHMEFLETLERRWQRMDVLSADIAEHFSAFLQETQPMHCMKELHAGLELSPQHSNNCAGRPLLATGPGEGESQSAMVCLREHMHADQRASHHNNSQTARSPEQ